jgi:NAD(P)-dependent dehydrogenase (short-subunit alcohol dehydrogenase family)
VSEPAPGIALVTGAAARIGRAIAVDLGGRGWAVAVHHRSAPEAAQEVVDEIAVAGGRAVALAADLADETRTRALVREAAAALGPLTCLVNNASVFEHDNAETATPESWERHMAVNLRAPFALIQDFAAQVVEGAAAGNVVNILDQRVWNLTPHFTSYTVSKSALWTLTRSLALALAPGVRVNAIGPGPTLASTRQSESQFAAQCAATPLGRGTTPEEICDAVRFILAAPAMTGQMIALDGGQHLDWAPANRHGIGIE